MSELVITVIEGGVADVRLNRPEKHNGLSTAMFEQITAAGEALKSEKSVRAVVLSGEGPSFCSGLDVGGSSLAPGAIAEKMKAVAGSPANFFQKPAWVWRELGVPVIAAIHGATFGGGLQIALAADIRIAHPETKLSVMEVQLGLIPDMTGSVTLLQLLPLDVAKELALTGRKLSGTEAAALGLVTRVAEDPRAEAMALAREIAGRNPDATRSIKQMMEANFGAPAREALAREAELQMKIIGTKNHMEAMMARMQKRAAKFDDPK